MINTRNKKLFIVAIITLVILAIVGAAIYTQRDNQAVSKNPDETKETINYAPASPVEKKESEDRKDEIVREQAAQTSAPATSGKKAVTPTITSADPLRVTSYITGIFEEDGVCTATFTKGGTSKTKSSTGFGNASYTQCAPIEMEAGFLTSGSWQLTIKYSSVKSEGTSAIKQVDVP